MLKRPLVRQIANLTVDHELAVSVVQIGDSASHRDRSATSSHINMAGRASNECWELKKLESGELNGSYWLGNRRKRVRVVAVIRGDSGKHFAFDVPCDEPFGHGMYRALIEWEKRQLVESRFIGARWWANAQPIAPSITPEEVRSVSIWVWCDECI